MMLSHLGVGYLAIGVACALGLVIARRAAGTDAVLVVGLWPIWVPLVLARPDARTARAPDLAAHIREMTDRVAELERVLARPDYDLATLDQREHELVDRGAAELAETVRARRRAIAEMHALRDRYRADLDQLRELAAQRAAAAELERLSNLDDRSDRPDHERKRARVEYRADERR